MDESADFPLAEAQARAAATEQWREILCEDHSRIRLAHRLFRYLPSPPRCKVCHNPFGGVGGKLVGLAP